LSNEILGVTLLAWGNSIADFIANLAVAKQGYPQMAIAACFGGPLLSILLQYSPSFTADEPAKEPGNEVASQYVVVAYLTANKVTESFKP
jgi:Ca2+/Na+ antiporter